MNRTKPPLRRARRGRLVAGVCAGVARRFGWNVTVVRILWLIGTLIPVLPGLPVYLAIWLFVPRE